MNPFIACQSAILPARRCSLGDSLVGISAEEECLSDFLKENPHCRAQPLWKHADDKSLWQGGAACPFGFFGSTCSREIQGFLRSRWSVEMTGFGWACKVRQLQY